MEKKRQNNRKLKERSEKNPSENVVIPLDTKQKALAKSGTKVKSALSNGTRKPASTGKKIATGKNSEVAVRKSSQTEKSQTKIKTVNAVSRRAQTSGSNNNIVPQNNGASGKSTFSVASFYISILLVLFILFFCILPLKQVSYEVPVVYQDTEIYTEQIPYIETVYYTEQQPYTTTEAYTVREPYISYQPQYMPPPRPPLPPPPTDNTTMPLPPPPPPQPIPEYREVIRYSNVTKYQNVVRYQEVEKAREQIRYKTVNNQRTVDKIKLETRYKMVPLLYSLVAY
jgi:hypothetical protein